MDGGRDKDGWGVVFVTTLGVLVGVVLGAILASFFGVH